MSSPCNLYLHHLGAEDLCSLCGHVARAHSGYIGPEWLADVLKHADDDLRQTVQNANEAVLNEGMVHLDQIAIVQLADKLAEKEKENAELKAKIEELTRVH